MMIVAMKMTAINHDTIAARTSRAQETPRREAQQSPRTAPGETQDSPRPPQGAQAAQTRPGSSKSPRELREAKLAGLLIRM